MDLHLGDPGAAIEGLELVRDIAAPLDHEHYLRLANLGQAVALSLLDQRDGRFGASFTGRALARRG